MRTLNLALDWCLIVRLHRASLASVALGIEDVSVPGLLATFVVHVLLRFLPVELVALGIDAAVLPLAINSIQKDDSRVTVCRGVSRGVVLTTIAIDVASTITVFAATIAILVLVELAVLPATLVRAAISDVVVIFLSSTTVAVSLLIITLLLSGLDKLPLFVIFFAPACPTTCGTG